MKDKRGKKARGQPASRPRTVATEHECDDFCPERTLAERQHEALGNMMHGLRLLIVALFLILLAETAAAAPSTTDPSVSALLGWGLLFFALLIVAGATWHQTRRRRTRRDPADRNAAAARHERSPDPEAGSSDLTRGLIDPDAFEHEARAHWDRCICQDSHLALIAMAVDSPDQKIGNGSDHLAEAVGQSISGLVQYHGGLMSQTGPGEFRIVAANLNPGEAVELAEDLQAAVEDLVLVSPDEPGRPITASFGLAAGKPDDRTALAGFIRAAGAALARAAQQGGNRIAQASPEDHA